MKIFGLFGFAAAEEIVRYDGDKVYGFENLTNGVIQHIKVNLSSLMLLLILTVFRPMMPLLADSIFGVPKVLKK